MLGAKTVLIAACVALALGQSAAASESRLRVRIHNKDASCGSGQSPMSVEGVSGVFCVSGQACVADIDGACPGAQTGLPYGAYCGTVKTGVKGCIPCAEGECDSDDSAECGDGESPMSVEGVEGIFCVSGQACVADINGACPGVQDGLPYGSSCGIVKTGVYGCKPNSAHHHHKSHHKSHHKDTTCGSGQSPMSVEGVEGVFCVSGQACVADIDGACPGAQTGLPYGAYCGTVKTGVKGCIPCAEGECDSDDSAECGDGESPMSVEGVEGIFCVSGQACVADINGACPGVQDGLPYGSSCGIVKTGVYGCKPNSAHHHHHKSHHKDTTCGSGQSPMSVEGVSGVFCVSGQACVADIDGACPGAQTGLPYGAYCGTVKTGVKGCIPCAEGECDSDDSAECGDGESPMSVEGVEGIFCVSGQACVADINGSCPGVQDGLPYGSSCGIVKTGVYGCKPNSAHHHHKSHKSHKKAHHL